MNANEITRQHDLTIEEVKSLPMFSHFSDEQAGEVVRTVKRFAEIIFKNHQNGQHKNNINPHTARKIINPKIL